MRKLLLLLCFVSLSSILLANQIQPLITGPGVEDISRDEFSGVIGVITGPDSQGYIEICGGTLIHPGVVITAAHCIYAKNRYDYRNQMDKITIVTGENILTGRYTLTQAQEVALHPQWAGESLLEGDKPVGDNGDVALIKLREPLDLEPVKLAEDAPSINTQGVIIGYGIYTSNDDYGIRRKGLSNVKEVREGIIEIGTPNGTCTGDSGGPFLVDNNGTWEIAGITSFGYTPPNNYCEPDWGNYDTNISFYRDWIDVELERLSEDVEVPDSDMPPVDDDNEIPDNSTPEQDIPAEPDENNIDTDTSGNDFSSSNDEDNTIIYNDNQIEDDSGCSVILL